MYEGRWCPFPYLYRALGLGGCIIRVPGSRSEVKPSNPDLFFSVGGPVFGLSRLHIKEIRFIYQVHTEILIVLCLRRGKPCMVLIFSNQL